MFPQASVSKTVSATQRVASWLTHFGVSEYAFDDTLSLINPLLTVHRLHAKVVGKVQETPSACSLILQAGPAFTGLVPGQYVMVGVVIDGVRKRRAYSPRAIEGRTNQFAITVQRQANGAVSNHIHDHIRLGDIIEIEAASGAFVLPSTLPKNVLMIAGGSGITPIQSMVEHLHRTKAATHITLLYFARSEADRIFAAELKKLSSAWPQLNYVPIVSEVFSNDNSQPQPTLNTTLLDERAPAWRETSSYCCGPAPLMDAARSIWQNASLSAQLKLEAFAPSLPTGDANAIHHITIKRAHDVMSFEAAGNQTLLESGEAAGHVIKHGCRQGICHECTCRLDSGSIKDLSTGEQINGNGQVVRLCVTTAMSDLELQTLS